MIFTLMLGGIMASKVNTAPPGPPSDARTMEDTTARVLEDGTYRKKEA